MRWHSYFKADFLACAYMPMQRLGVALLRPPPGAPATQQGHGSLALRPPAGALATAAAEAPVPVYNSAAAFTAAGGADCRAVDLPADYHLEGRASWLSRGARGRMGQGAAGTPTVAAARFAAPRATALSKEQTSASPCFVEPPIHLHGASQAGPGAGRRPGLPPLQLAAVDAAATLSCFLMSGVMHELMNAVSFGVPRHGMAGLQLAFFLMNGVSFGAKFLEFTTMIAPQRDWGPPLSDFCRTYVYQG